MELFQRQITTVAYRLAGGVDLSNSSSLMSRGVKQNPIPPAFVSKITKAFIDVLYAFLDGLVRLVEDEREGSTSVNIKGASAGTPANGNTLELLDLSDKVGGLCLCPTSHFEERYTHN